MSLDYEKQIEKIKEDIPEKQQSVEDEKTNEDDKGNEK